MIIFDLCGVRRPDPGRLRRASRAVADPRRTGSARGSLALAILALVVLITPGTGAQTWIGRGTLLVLLIVGVERLHRLAKAEHADTSFSKVCHEAGDWFSDDEPTVDHRRRTLDRDALRTDRRIDRKERRRAMPGGPFWFRPLLTCGSAAHANQPRTLALAVAYSASSSLPAECRSASFASCSASVAPDAVVRMYESTAAC